MQMSCERVCVTVNVYVVLVWQGPMEEQFLYWMDFTLYKYIWNKKINKVLFSSNSHVVYAVCLMDTAQWYMCLIKLRGIS